MISTTKKVLFIVPPNITFDDFINPSENVKTMPKGAFRYGAVITDIPLGVLSLSAYLKKYISAITALLDFNIVLNKLQRFDFNSFPEFFNDVLERRRMEGETPHIIGISTLFVSSYRNMLDIAHCCRNVFPKAIIIAGGGVPTNMYREIFRDSKCFDALSFGEGEKPLTALVCAKDTMRYLEEAPSWITRKKVETEQPFVHDFIDELDEIPFFDFDILNIEEYNLNPTISAYLDVGEEKKTMTVMTSRGCTHRCCFCSSHTVHGRKMRYHSIARIRNDFTHLKKCYGAKTIIFQDDHFLADRQRAFDIIEILHELQLTAFFPNSLALYALDRKMLEALKGAGVNQLVLSVESGSERVLRQIMHKPLKLSIVTQVADDCRELGIYTDLNILIGLPGETKQDIEDARKFLKTINANWFRINVATPLVGSEMFDICVEKKYIKGQYLDCNFKKAIVETEDFSAEYIQEKAYLLNLELNFLENSDFRLGYYETALKGFENAIRAKGDHAVAYYCASLALEKIGNFDKAAQYMDTAKAITTKSSLWRKFADIFNMPI